MLLFDFTVDASEAGSGNIEIMVNKGRIACNVQNLGSYKFLASFVPTKVEKHTVEMKFNNLPVIGKSWISAVPHFCLHSGLTHQ
jgi:filamin